MVTSLGNVGMAIQGWQSGRYKLLAIRLQECILQRHGIESIFCNSCKWSATFKNCVKKSNSS